AAIEQALSSSGTRAFKIHDATSIPELLDEVVLHGRLGLMRQSATRFLQKAMEREHLRPIEYATGRHVYHLKAKLLYSVINQPDSQNRREKSDREIKLRLMQLDYVLDHPDRKFLESGSAKVEFFHSNLRLPMTTLPRRGDQIPSHSRFFPDRMPIAVTEKRGDFPFVSFAFVDEGQRSLSSLERWLEQHDALLHTLPNLEVVYVADSPRNFDGAEHQFLRRFSNSHVKIRGHLLEYDYPLWSMKYRRATP
ncbi:MAG TPA: hypothetical protein VM578_00380, partial [Candidatus Saccharimonadales bacterium]|nr:hypothetical protein [Candidatus Saccharimonadales bacterium]